VQASLGSRSADGDAETDRHEPPPGASPQAPWRLDGRAGQLGGPDQSVLVGLGQQRAGTFVGQCCRLLGVHRRGLLLAEPLIRNASFERYLSQRPLSIFW
jgi:hypothetical protein